MKPHVPHEVQKKYAALLRDHQLRVHYQAQRWLEPKEYVINLLGEWARLSAIFGRQF